jgi:hypothetical protein
VLTTASTFEMSPRLVRTRPARTHSASPLPLNLSSDAASRPGPIIPQVALSSLPGFIQVAFEERATRILTFKEGEHTPSTSPALLEVLTDDNIVVAVAAIKAVAARQPAPPSANAQKKLSGPRDSAQAAGIDSLIHWARVVWSSAAHWQFHGCEAGSNANVPI